MTLQEYIQHLKSGKPVYPNSELIQYMGYLSHENNSKTKLCLSYTG